MARKILFWGGAHTPWGDIRPDDIDSGDRMFGGRETALIKIAESLTRLGWEVKCFVKCEHAFEWRGVSFLPQSYFLPLCDSERASATVSIEDPSVFEKVNAPGLKIVHCQCAHLPINEKMDAGLDLYFGISEFQRWSMTDAYPAVDASKFRVIPNGIEIERFAVRPTADTMLEMPVNELGQVPGRLVYSSSPDRGLHHLVDWMPQITESVPGAHATVFYEFKQWYDRVVWSNYVEGDIAARIRHGIQHSADVHHFGAVNQTVLANALMNGQVLAYPFDPLGNTETFCITIMEALAAGMEVVTVDTDCLREWYEGMVTFCQSPVEGPEFMRKVAEALRRMEDPEHRAHRLEIGRRFASRFQWDQVAADWIRAIDAAEAAA